MYARQKDLERKQKQMNSNQTKSTFENAEIEKTIASKFF